MQLPTEVRDRLRRLGHALLLPGVADRPQQRQQRRRGSDQHPPRHRILDQRRVGLERGAVQMLAGQEHDDEVGSAVEPGPVRLVGQRLDVLAQQPRVISKVALALGLVTRLVGVENALQRRLGVDDDLLAARQLDDQVGAQGRVVARDRRLL